MKRKYEKNEDENERRTNEGRTTRRRTNTKFLMKERAKIKKKTIINLEMSRNVTSEPKMYFAYFDRKVTTW